MLKKCDSIKTMSKTRIFDSSQPNKRTRVADRTPEEIAEYRANMELVREQVEKIRNGQIKALEPIELQPHLQELGIGLVEEILYDPQDRPHRRICQGRAASCKINSFRREAYLQIAGAKRSVIERAIAIAQGYPDPGPPTPKKGKEDVFSFTDQKQEVEADWQKQLKEAANKLQLDQE